MLSFKPAGRWKRLSNGPYMYFLPMGLVLEGEPSAVRAAALSSTDLAGLGIGSVAANIAAATLGNVIGGAVLVGLVYWFVYLRPADRASGTRRPDRADSTSPVWPAGDRVG